MFGPNNNISQEIENEEKIDIPAKNDFLSLQQNNITERSPLVSETQDDYTSNQPEHYDPPNWYKRCWKYFLCSPEPAFKLISGFFYNETDYKHDDNAQQNLPEQNNNTRNNCCCKCCKKIVQSLSFPFHGLYMPLMSRKKLMVLNMIRDICSQFAWCTKIFAYWVFFAMAFDAIKYGEKFSDLFTLHAKNHKALTQNFTTLEVFLPVLIVPIAMMLGVTVKHLLCKKELSSDDISELIEKVESAAEINTNDSKLWYGYIRPLLNLIPTVFQPPFNCCRFSPILKTEFDIEDTVHILIHDTSLANDKRTKLHKAMIKLYNKSHGFARLGLTQMHAQIVSDIRDDDFKKLKRQLKGHNSILYRSILEIQKIRAESFKTLNSAIQQGPSILETPEWLYKLGILFQTGEYNVWDFLQKCCKSDTLDYTLPSVLAILFVFLTAFFVIEHYGNIEWWMEIIGSMYALSYPDEDMSQQSHLNITNHSFSKNSNLNNDLYNQPVLQTSSAFRIPLPLPFRLVSSIFRKAASDYQYKKRENLWEQDDIPKINNFNNNPTYFLGPTVYETSLSQKAFDWNIPLPSDNPLIPIRFGSKQTNQVLCFSTLLLIGVLILWCYKKCRTNKHMHSSRVNKNNSGHSKNLSGFFHYFTENEQFISLQDKQFKNLSITKALE